MDRLLTDTEIEEIFKDRPISRWAPREERQTYCKEQDAKTGRLVRKETAEEIFRELESKFVDAIGWHGIDKGDYEALKQYYRGGA